MERVIFIEILDRRGRVRERVRLDRLPATLGRAYTNDVIVEDRFVSPVHCTIREGNAGELVVEDRDSLNGLRSASARHPVSALVLCSGDRFRLGETVLRLVEGGHAVAPAEPMTEYEGGVLSALRARPVAFAAVALCVSVLTLDQYLASYYDPNWVNVVSPAVLGLSALALWAGVWALVNRLTTHRFDFVRHFACACLATVAIVLGSSVAEYAEFVFSSQNLGEGILVLIQVGSTLWLLRAHLSILSASTGRRHRLWALGGTLVLLALTYLFGYEGGADVVSELPVSVPLKSLGGESIPASNTEEFLEKARWVREWVDEKALEREP